MFSWTRWGAANSSTMKLKVTMGLYPNLHCSPHKNGTLKIDWLFYVIFRNSCWAVRGFKTSYPIHCIRLFYCFNVHYLAQKQPVVPIFLKPWNQSLSWCPKIIINVYISRQVSIPLTLHLFSSFPPLIITKSSSFYALFYVTSCRDICFMSLSNKNSSHRKPGTMHARPHDWLAYIWHCYDDTIFPFIGPQLTREGSRRYHNSADFISGIWADDERISMYFACSATRLQLV